MGIVNALRVTYCKLTIDPNISSRRAEDIVLFEIRRRDAELHRKSALRLPLRLAFARSVSAQRESNTLE